MCWKSSLFCFLFLYVLATSHGWKFSLTPETKAKLSFMLCKLRNFCLPYKWQVCAHDDGVKHNRIFYNHCYMLQHNACNWTNYFVLDLFEADFYDHPEICLNWKYTFRKTEKPREVPIKFPAKLWNHTFYFK